MSRQSNHPPRCPFLEEHMSIQNHESYSQHTKSPSQGSILEEHPAWLDELLDDEESDSKGCQSVSNSVTMLNSSAYTSSGANSYNIEDISVGNEIYCRLEAHSAYGPNSPRQRSNINFLENATTSALLEYVFQNALQYVDDTLCISENSDSGPNGDACSSAVELNAETITFKRHPGQRSRVRKLQYITELERTIVELKNLESELAVRVASLLQQRVALSIENSRLKQHVARLQQEKLITESQHISLKKEVERLKDVLVNQANGEMRTHFGHPAFAEATGSNAAWQNLISPYTEQTSSMGFGSAH
ncbi:hypothetical protein K2173_025107 [Erythroxylum novogranatense]|uniref:Uncharacterized protein n=1 Tax=Erythroxylum novogranatense TaxID=1862640 RepID=A0AAV8SVI5_9ROSI|nr:hypothetical protein K2173_025107 [Erythroxylum novogranatense]